MKWLLVFFFYSASAAAAPFTVERSDGSAVTSHFYSPEGVSEYPVTIIVQGSQCEALGESPDQRILFIRDHLKSAVLMVEKPGLPSTEAGCPKEYLERNTIDQRVEDIQLALNHVRRHLQDWNRDLLWIGGSEGGVVAALASSQAPETKAVVLLAGAGAMTMAEELLLLERKRLKKDGANDTAIETNKNELLAKFQEIRDNPTPEKTWWGETNTYKWWASILDRESFSALKDLKVPVYIAHGTADLATPIESGDLLAEKLQPLLLENLTYVRHDGLDHHWNYGTHDSGESRAYQMYSGVLIWIMVQNDQKLRFQLIEEMKKDPNSLEVERVARQLGTLDATNTSALKLLISMAGFPLISTHGERANNDGWLLVQHADRDVEFQKSVLEILQKALETEDTNRANVAYLTDRVMVNERGQRGESPLQLFGTQLHQGDNGCLIPWTIEDAENVNLRRHSYDLEPLEEYVEKVNQFYLGRSCPEATKANKPSAPPQTHD